MIFVSISFHSTWDHQPLTKPCAWPRVSPPLYLEDWIDVAIREPESERGYFSKLVTTSQSRRCLNLGSYNYLGFGGLNTHCTPMVLQSIMDHPITSGASLAEMGYSAPVKVGSAGMC